MGKLNIVYNENCMEGIKKLESESIDCCVTSPPYWNLRDYEVEGQLGVENTHIEYIDKLIEIFNEVYRVLKPSGTCFVNLGDSYGGSGAGKTINADTNKYIENSKQIYVLPNGMAKSCKLRNTNLNKSLLMIPERFAIKMLDNKWILRNQIIWHKPNSMPSSATDRFTVDFEKIFFFVKNAKEYYFEQQLEKSIWSEIDKRAKSEKIVISQGKSQTQNYAINGVKFRNDGMRNVRAVWSVNTKGINEHHFAPFPQKIVHRMIKSGSPEAGIVLDPFMGVFTTAIVAKKLNRNYIGFELNKEYIKIGEKRLEKEIGMF